MRYLPLFLVSADVFPNDRSFNTGELSPALQNRRLTSLRHALRPRNICLASLARYVNGRERLLEIFCVWPRVSEVFLLVKVVV